MKALVRVLERLDGVQQNGSGYKARCPVPGHGQGRGDRNPSLSVSEGSEGRVLINCRAGCRTVDVVAELGLEMKDLFEHDGKGGGGAFTPSRNPETLHPRDLRREDKGAGWVSAGDGSL
jgi:hypothetical protein